MIKNTIFLRNYTFFLVITWFIRKFAPNIKQRTVCENFLLY